MKLSDLKIQINGMTKQMQARELDKQVHESGECRCSNVLGCQGHVRAIDGIMTVIQAQLTALHGQREDLVKELDQ